MMTPNELQAFLDGFQERLAASMQRALDTVTSDMDQRLRVVEEDQARILRHLGLDHNKKVTSNKGREIL